MEAVFFLLILLPFELLLFWPWEAYFLTLQEADKFNPGVFRWGILSFSLGCMVGVVTILLLPELLIRSIWIQFLNLIIAPILAGKVASRMVVRKQLLRNKPFIPVEKNVWIAIMFMAGLVLIRFICGHR